MPTMDTYPAQTTPNNSDYHIINDGVSGVTKKITRQNYLAGAALPTNAVTTAAITDGSVTSAKVAAGMAVQIVSTNYSAFASGTGIIPYDDTIPQNTEGTEFMTQAITPKSATNILSIDVTFFGAHTALTNYIMALFQDSGVNALSATNISAPGAGYLQIITLRYSMVAGTTSSTTFKVRAGGSAAGTMAMNGDSGARRFGGVAASNIRIIEYKA